VIQTTASGQSAAIGALPLPSRKPPLGSALPVQNGKMIEAGRRPGILARMLGSMLQAAREVAGLSYDEAAARLGCQADWLIRVETGFAVVAPEELARILVEYGVRDAAAADQLIDLARRVASPPPWLAAHASRLTAANRDVLLVEAESTLAQVHGFLLIPQLVQAEGYFRAIAPGVYPGRDVDQEWELLSGRQAHRPAGVMRLLEVMIDEEALALRSMRPEVMAGQVRHLLELADSPHAAVRVIPKGAPFWEKRGHNFDVLSFAGTTDRIGVCYYPVLGAEIVSADVYDIWAGIESTAAVGVAESRAILERHLTALS
jgi:transcriptional regulator with XRE-family HTH domain